MPCRYFFHVILERIVRFQHFIYIVHSCILRFFVVFIFVSKMKLFLNLAQLLIISSKLRPNLEIKNICKKHLSNQLKKFYQLFILKLILLQNICIRKYVQHFEHTFQTIALLKPYFHVNKKLKDTYTDNFCSGCLRGE